MEYQPDKWVVIKLGDTYKVLAHWSGGYLDGDYWRLNSGVVGISRDGDFYIFKGWSGSVYRCHKLRYGLSSLTSFIYAELMGKSEEVGDVDVEMLSLDEVDELEIREGEGDEHLSTEG